MRLEMLHRGIDVDIVPLLLLYVLVEESRAFSVLAGTLASTETLISVLRTIEILNIRYCVPLKPLYPAPRKILEKPHNVCPIPGILISVTAYL